MKNAENVNVLKDKKGPRAGTKKAAEALLARTEEIQVWADQIMNAKGAAQTKLREAFKQEFGQVYNTKLLDRLNIKRPEQVLIDEATDLIQQAVADESREREVAGSLAQVKEFQDEASVIDAERKDVVTDTINKAAEKSGLSKILDKIFKGEPYFDEGDVDFPAEDPSQDIDQYANARAQIEAARQAEVAAAEAEALADYQESLVDEDIESELFNGGESAEDRDAREAKERMDEFINQSVDAALAKVAAEDEAADKEKAALNVEPEPASSNDVQEENGADGSMLPASKEQNLDNEKLPSKYFEDAVEIFESLNISSKDLDTIPGFENMNKVSQLLVAKSLKSLALERARGLYEGYKKWEVAVASTRFSRLITKIGQVFRRGKMEKEAATDEINGGLARHGADLTRLSEWVRMFDLKEKTNQDGEPQVSFMERLDLTGLDEEQRKLVSNFDEVANLLSGMPKHWLKKEGSVPEGSKEFKQSELYERARQEYESLRAQMGDLMANKLDLGERFAMEELNAADAKLNTMQLMAANPELEKEWSQMLSGGSMIKQALAKDNWKFLAGGFVARGGVRLGFGYAFGATAGVVALPFVAAALGAWRGGSRARKGLIAADRFIDKKEINQSDLFKARQQALRNLQDLEPKKYVDNPRAWQTLSEQRSKWKESLSPEDLAAYEAALSAYQRANSAWEKEEQKNTERKVFKADDLIAKIEALTKKYDEEHNYEIFTAIQDQIARRVIFTKNLADRGLVNFGDMEERTAQSLKFYQVLANAQMHIWASNKRKSSYKRTENVESEDGGGLAPKVIEIDMKQRAAALLSGIESMSEYKLDKKRRAHVIRMMQQGAIMGGAFALAGAVVGELTGHWVSDKIGEGYRFVKGAIFNKDEAAATVITAAASEGASSSVEATVSESAATNAAETAVTATQESAAQTLESASKSTAESAVQATASSAGAESASVEAAAKAQQAAAAQAAPSGESVAYVNKIDQAGDSVWRSTRDIFKDMAAELGFKGDLNDSAALSRWAETQANRALANSGELADKVFIGNEVVLERSGDGFLVSVEAAAGATPGFREVAEETVDNAVAASTSGDPKIVPDIANPEALADAAGSKFGLRPEEVVATTTPNIIQANIDGNDVFINIVDNTYAYFNEAADEVSGLLVDGAGNPVTDLKAFFADGLTLDNGDLLDSGAVEGAFVNEPDLSEAGLRESADKIGLFMLERSASSVETLYNQVLHEIEGATGLESLKEVMSPKESRIFERLVNQIHEDGYNAASHQKALTKFITRLVTRYGE